jgi:hypothetical protein
VSAPPGKRTVNTEALARFARDRHVAAHHACELAREGKAEPRPAVATRGQRIRLGECLEQFRLLFGGQANAGRPIAPLQFMARTRLRRMSSLRAA